MSTPIQNEDTLFKLIHSMSKGEKRFFQLNYSTATGGSKQFLELYKAYNKLEEYSQEGLLALLPNHFSLWRLSQIKNYLKSSLIKSIEAYNCKCKRNLLTNLINQANTLFNRGFIHESYKYANVANRIAIKYWLMNKQLDIIDLQLKIANQLGKGNKYGLKTKNIIHKKIKLINSMDIINRVSLLSIEADGNEPHYELITKTEKEEKALTPLALAKSYHAIANFFLVHGKYDLAINYSERAMALWERSTAKDGDSLYMEDYMKAIFLNINILQHLGALDQCKKLLKKMELHEERFTQFPALKVEYKFHYITTILKLYPALQKDDRLQEYIEILEKENFCLSLNTQQRLQLIASIASYYFYAAEWKISLVWINLIINGKIPADCFHILSKARILRVLTHFELGNYELAIYFIRKIKYCEGLLESEKMLMNAVRLSIRGVENNEFMEVMESMLLEKKEYRVEVVDLLPWVKKQIDKSEALMDQRSKGTCAA